MSVTLWSPIEKSTKINFRGVLCVWCVPVIFGRKQKASVKRLNNAQNVQMSYFIWLPPVVLQFK